MCMMSLCTGTKVIFLIPYLDSRGHFWDVSVLSLCEDFCRVSRPVDLVGCPQSMSIKWNCTHTSSEVININEPDKLSISRIQ